MQRDVEVNWGVVLCPHILVGALLGILSAAFLFYMTPPLWEASALFQIGQIRATNGNADRSSSGAETSVENPEAVALEMVRPQFIKGTLDCAHQPELLKSMLPRQFNGKGRFSVQLLSAGLVEIRARVPSQAGAQKVVDCARQRIVEEHNNLLGERFHYSKIAQQDLQNMLMKKSALAKDVSHGLDSADMPSDNVDKPVVDDALSGADYRAVRLKLVLSSMMGEPYNLPTRPIGQVEVITEPVSPSFVLYAALGLLMGGGISWVFVKVKKKLASKKLSPSC